MERSLDVVSSVVSSPSGRLPTDKKTLEPGRGLTLMFPEVADAYGHCRRFFFYDRPNIQYVTDEEDDSVERPSRCH